MSSRSPSNVSASVKARLQNRAKEAGQTYQGLLQRYVIERFLYRLASSPHGAAFVLKGALLFTVWDELYLRRTTMDIDLLGFTENSLEHLSDIVQAVCVVRVEDDGVTFDAESAVARRIKEDADYEGVKVGLFAYLERTRVQLQIDIGFGDLLVPAAQSVRLPSMLGLPTADFRCYHQLTVMAEKFEAMVKLGFLNSSMKDFYDIWNISQHKAVLGKDWQAACVATFGHRHTRFETSVDIFSSSFAESKEKQRQWAAFCKKQNTPDGVPAEFRVVAVALQEFLLPVVQHQVADRSFQKRWSPSGPWQS